ncbi:MAG: polysaccharide deacetylase family protein [Mollicutes bacterium]|nr:polysaccharide deacetylase family protein [Mollicutes bacterium]
MKKFFQAIGMLTLMCLSFIYAEKTAMVVKETDSLMMEIKKQNVKYKEEPIDALIENNVIRPGLNGKEINENKSYLNMKRIGNYNPKLLEYQVIKPKISIEKIYDKYVIGGNVKKNLVSIVFIVNNNDNINQILTILEDKKVKSNFFIDSVWLENNNDKIMELIKKGHVIGNLSYNMDYNHSDFIWMDTIIRKIGNQKKGYCYTERENTNALKICALHKNHTIKPEIIVKKYPLIEIKKQIKNGSIISLPINMVVESELISIINYIEAKGYKIVTLNELLSEDNEL